MSLSRRTFLTSTAAVAAAAAAGTALDPAAAQAVEAAPAARALRRSTFAPWTGRHFTATGNGVRARLRLRRIRDIAGVPAGDAIAFALQFSAPHHLPDGTYTLSHPRAGRHLLYVSGVNDAAQRRYEVVVNRSKA
jgi:anaerobic selenocysteine-containing dehydrogenase